MNLAYGAPSPASMPFNMRHLRFPITTYDLADSASDSEKRREHEKQASALEKELLGVLASDLYKNERNAHEASERFIPKEPAGGLSRFRPAHLPLGISDNLVRFGNAHDVFLIDGPAIWLRVMPVKSQNRTWKPKELQSAATNEQIVLIPLLYTSGGFNFLRADDGFGVYTPLQDQTKAVCVAFVFENGEVWSTNSYVVSAISSNSKETKPGLWPIEYGFKSAFAGYVKCLGKLGIKPPYKWIAGIEGIIGFGLYYPAPAGQRFIDSGPHGTCVSQIIFADDIASESESPADVLKRFFAKVFEKCGLDRPDYFDNV